MTPVVRLRGRLTIGPPPWGCLLVDGGPHDDSGYPIAWIGRRRIRLMRITWCLAHGVDLDDARGLHGHHRCERKRCIDPAHVQMLTASQHGRVHALGPGSVRPYGIAPGRGQLLGRTS